MEEETPRAAAAFHEYCLMGPSRSLRKLAASNQLHIKSASLLLRWSDEYHWQARVKEYDASVAAERRAKREALIDEMNRRQQEQAQVLADKAFERINKQLDSSPKLSLYALSQLRKNETELERLALEGDELARRIEALELALKEREIRP